MAGFELSQLLFLLLLLLSCNRILLSLFTSFPLFIILLAFSSDLVTLFLALFVISFVLGSLFVTLHDVLFGLSEPFDVVDEDLLDFVIE